MSIIRCGVFGNQASLTKLWPQRGNPPNHVAQCDLAIQLSERLEARGSDLSCFPHLREKGPHKFEQLQKLGGPKISSHYVPQKPCGALFQVSSCFSI